MPAKGRNKKKAKPQVVKVLRWMASDGSVLAEKVVELCAGSVCPHCQSQEARLDVGGNSYTRHHLEHVTNEWLSRGIIA